MATTKSHLVTFDFHMFTNTLKTSLLSRLQVQTLLDATPLIGNNPLFCKNATTLESNDATVIFFLNI